MVGLPYDCLVNPLGAVRLTFERALASGSDPAALDGKDWGAVDLFREFLFDQGGLYQVPILNARTIRYIQPNTLVRFRGMIQDMLGNEFYAGAHKDGSTWKTNKYTDAFQFPLETLPDMRIWERRLFYCVPVPGQNPWADESSDVNIIQGMNSNLQHGEKRRRVEDEGLNEMEMQISDDAAGGSGAKKMRESGHPSESSQSQASITETSCFSPSKFPKVDSDRLSCLIKVYDSADSEVKLNEIFEFVGVFTFDYDHNMKKDDGDDDLQDDLCEDVASQLPPNKVPRLHCLIHRKLAIQDFVHCPPSMELKSPLTRNVREALLGHFSTILGNDGLAAHFLLLHLLSKVHARVDALAVGKLSLNLTSFSKETASVFSNQLKLAIENLLPFTHCIPLTVEYLNAGPLAPSKDYETNRLVTGVLQVPESSHVIVDETKLEVGTLNSIGVNNTRVLKDLIELQKVDYDFKYYKMEVTADVQLLVLSEGKSNILPADLVVPFRPSSVACSEALSKEAVEAWRWYLAAVRTLPHSIEPEMQKVLENDLVSARQANKSLGSQDFSRLLTLGRLMSLSYGETSLSLEHWQMVKEMERLRLERLS